MVFLNKKKECGRSFFGFVIKCTRSATNPGILNTIECMGSAVFAYEDCIIKTKEKKFKINNQERMKFRNNIRIIKYDERKKLNKILMDVKIVECVNCKTRYNRDIVRCEKCGSNIFRHLNYPISNLKVGLT